MAIVIEFPAARILHDPKLRALRARIGPLSPDENAGLHALDAGECDADTLRDNLAAGIDVETWKRYLRAFRQLGATATAE